MWQTRVYPVLVVLVAASGCGHASLKSSCGSRLARFEHQFEAVELGLAPWRPRAVAGASAGKSNRAPASSSETDSTPQLSARDRESWKKLARESLDEAQRLIDLAEEDPSLASAQRKLNEVANQIVSLHSYAEAGRIDRMFDVLEEIRKANAVVRSLACTGN